MKTWIKVLVVTIVLAVALGRVIWPPPAGASEPSPGQFPFFVALSAFDALAFGLGVAFFLFGLPKMRLVAGG